MAWLKKQQPFKLYQSSDIPYIILEDGIRLCFSNCFGQNPDKSDYNLNFIVQTSSLRRINTFFYKIEPFPITIPFSDVISLDDSVVEGRTIKHFANNTEEEQKNISVVKSEYIRNNISDLELSDFYDNLKNFDHNFILTGETIDPQTRLFDNLSTILHHKDWNRTIVSIANDICSNSYRKYCWTKLIPELQISYFGNTGAKDIPNINDACCNAGLDVSVNWED